jgi:hypothetical protein
MRTFAQKQNQPQKPVSSSLALSNTATRGLHHPADRILHLQRTIRNQAVLRMLQTQAEEPKAGLTAVASPRLGHDFSRIPIHPPASTVLQTKLVINTPGDRYEQEADHVAERVMRMPEPGALAVSGSTPGLQRKCSCGGTCARCQGEQVKHSGSGASERIAAPPIVHEVLRSPSQPLDPAARTSMELRLGLDLSRVRVHADGGAAKAVAAVHARAFTVGRDIVFGSGEYAPASAEGKRLLAHELVHVAQSRHTAAPDVVRRKILPEDVSSELAGQQFTIRKGFPVAGKTLPAGTIVTVKSWSNTAEMADVSHPSVAGAFSVPKVLLEPVQTKVAGIAPYGAGVAKAEADVERGAAKLERFRNTPPKDRMKDFAQDLSQREAGQANRLKLLNERLIQASMLNRFDASIKKWVNFYNNQFGFKSKDALDPNLVKAMMYKESSMGTNEPFMSDPPTHPIMSRFNVLQVAADSVGQEILPIIHEMMPSLISKYHLENIEKDLIAVETEFEKLNKKPESRRTDPEKARLTELRALEDHGNWKPWFFAYPGFAPAVNEFLGTVEGGKKHSEDYDFWIRAGIHALFDKRKQFSTWEEAARANNGGGESARNYRDFVTRHMKGALKAEKEGRAFIPERL